jgi:MFS family permease
MTHWLLARFSRRVVVGLYTAVVMLACGVAGVAVAIIPDVMLVAMKLLAVLVVICVIVALTVSIVSDFVPERKRKE